MTTTTDTRVVSLADIPLVWRLSENGTVLDSEVGLTRDARGPHSALLSSILFPRGVYTLVARSDRQRVVGQFRYRPDDYAAHIVYLAPTLSVDAEESVWLHILDAMAREAGKHGAHSLIAEVETSSQLFETLRTARFATYSRQTIWRHAPVAASAPDAADESAYPLLTEETSRDQIGIMSLICSTIPTILQHVTAPPGDMDGWVYRRDGQIDAYIAVSEGKHGVYVIPYIHPDVLDEAGALIQAAIARTPQARRVPIYISVRSYQSWLDGILEGLGFDAWVEQAIMVKHIAAGIRQSSFSRMRPVGQLEVANHFTPPSWPAMPDDVPCLATTLTDNHKEQPESIWKDA